MIHSGSITEGMRTAEWMRWQVAITRADLHPELPGEIRSLRDMGVACWTGCGRGPTWVVAKSREGRAQRLMCDSCAERFPIAPGMVVVAKTRPTKVRRPMTDDERQMAIALGEVTMVPGIPSKALARDLAEMATQDDATTTEAQAAALRSLVVRYRRQIPANVVRLAGAQGQAAAGGSS